MRGVQQERMDPIHRASARSGPNAKLGESGSLYFQFFFATDIHSFPSGRGRPNDMPTNHSVSATNSTDLSLHLLTLIVIV